VTSNLVAHAGAGASWQAMIVLAGVLLTGLLLAAALGFLTVERGDDLVVPIAATAVLSSLAPIGGEILSDAIGWGLPLFVVSLVTLLLAAFTPLDVRLPGPLPMGALALAVVSSVLLFPTLTARLHPPEEILPLRADSEVTVVTPDDGATVDGRTVEVVVAVSGGSIGPGELSRDELPADPEEAGDLAIAVARVDEGGGQQQRLAVDYREDCSVDRPCTEVSFAVELEPGDYELTVEFTRGDGVPLAPFVRDRVSFTVGGV
jgi:hypothetical protein